MHKYVGKKILLYHITRCKYTTNMEITDINANTFSKFLYFSNPGTENLQKKDSDKSSLNVNKSPDSHLSTDNVKDAEGEPNVRINDFGIQMINYDLFSKLFHRKNVDVDQSKITDCVKELQANNLFINETKIAPEVNLKLPKLRGGSIEEHFYNIGRELSYPYKKLLLKLMKGIPEVPEFWNLQPGWTRYSKNGFCKVNYPLEDAIVIDIEVCCKAGAFPTIATAVSSEAWYGWVSSELLAGDKTFKQYLNSTDKLIPLESSQRIKGFDLPASLLKHRIAIGHNVSFDRSKIKEQYWLEQTGMRFLDTMSLHVCVSGVTSYQKALLKAGVGEEEWTKLSALNSLSKVHNLYCGGELDKESRDLFISGSLDDIKVHFQEGMSYCAQDVVATFNVFKKVFPIFLERFPHPVTLAGMLEIQTAYLPVNKNWTKYISDSNNAYEDLDIEAKCLMSQCANDVCDLLHNDNYKKDLWMWDQDWSCKQLKMKKIKGMDKNCISKNNDNLGSVEVTDSVNCEKNCGFTTIILDNSNDKYHFKNLEGGDIVSEVFDSLMIKYSSILLKEKLLPSRTPYFPGYPEWYRKLCNPPDIVDWVPEPTLIATGLKITPKLLHLTWDSLPVHHEKGEGWGYLVPYKTVIGIEKEGSVPIEKLTKHFLRLNRDKLCSCSVYENKSHFFCKRKSYNKGSKLCKADLGFSCGLVKLPHKDGPGYNVGNPLAKDFINKFSENALSSDSIWAKRIIEINRMLSYWRNSRERIEKQFVCWLRTTDLPPSLQNEGDIGVILPHVVVCGTLTRRAVEPTWMTASNSSSERVGSELRSMVQAPPGYSLVGADVDSQELWIASLLGDAFAVGLHGATPLGWMTLNGQKADGTDMHSVSAKAVGISRNHAKILNYARIYGAGERFSQRLLKQFNEKIPLSETVEKAAKMMELTKGKKMFNLLNDVLPNLSQRVYNRDEALELCSLQGKEVDELFEKPKWLGGTESAMFNCLEMIANKPVPETPFLNCKLSRALEPRIDKNENNLPTRINWVVQSGAVDFLHLMLVSMRWFLGSKPRFCLSFHDEVRYLIQDEHKYEAALALHVTNLFTRAFCVSRVGMVDLPMSVAFFSSVEVDKVLRKESKDDNKTPSNPFGLSRGYSIPLGESLDIYQAIKKANGKIGNI